MIKLIKNNKYLLVFVFLLIICDILYFNFKKVSTEGIDINSLPVFNEQSIKEFNGTDLNKPVYIAFEGYVYDVSPGRADFYNDGMSYHYLAGRDSTVDLHIAGGSIIKRKYKIVGVYK